MLDANSSSKAGFVWLVGAGPGAPDLITLRGLRLLEQATAVVYDDLANAELLAHCPQNCAQHPVGKRAGRHNASQGEINELLVKLARAGHRVVRLKGGDPLVFGRAGEEMAALRAAGLPFELVPGVTAATAAGAVAGLPLTHRDRSSAVVFVTGHQCAANTGALDWDALTKLRATLCFYMGVRRLSEIAHNLIAHGMAPDMPLALISEATLPTQRVQVMRLDAAQAVPPEKIGQPAIVVIGHVVEHANFAEQVPALSAQARAT